MVTADTILNWLKKSTEEKIPISTALWLDAALKLTVFVADENEKFFHLQSLVAQAKVAAMETMEKPSVAKATLVIEASPLYAQMQNQGAKVEQIQEIVRIAKKQAELASWEEKIQR